MIPGQSHRKLDLGEPEPVKEPAGPAGFVSGCQSNQTSADTDQFDKPSNRIYLVQSPGRPAIHFINKEHALMEARRSKCPVCILIEHEKRFREER